MKRTLILIALFVTPFFSQAQLVDPELILVQKGVREARINGSFDVDSLLGADLDLDLGYGWFFRDYWQMGGSLYIENNDFVSAYGVKGFIEYSHETRTYWIPYAGLSAGFGIFDLDRGNSSIENSGAIVGPYIGVKYYFRHDLAWSLELDVDWASDDMFAEDDSVNSLDTKLKMGIRVMF